jgi:DNA-directed RNA polymerase subunit L
MKKWFKFEIEYQIVNPFSTDTKLKIHTNYQSAYAETLEKAQEHAIKCFEVERFGDKLLSIRNITE